MVHGETSHGTTLILASELCAVSILPGSYVCDVVTLVFLYGSMSQMFEVAHAGSPELKQGFLLATTLD